MAKIDYYQILGVSPDASIKAIKRAYRRLAVQYHPDKNPGDQAAHDQFQQISEAYAVLSDLQQRAAYDRRQNFKPQQESPLHTPQTKQERKKRKGKWINLFFFRGKPKPQRGFRAKKSPHRIALSGFNQFFGGFFSKPVPQKPKPAGPIRGANLQQDLELLLHEVAQGCRKQIDVQHEELCALCSGTGALHSARMRRCTRCKGSGVVEFEQGHFVVKQRCPRCYGEGNEIDQFCLDCHGTGKIEKTRQIVITLEPGIKEGARLKIPGQGESGRNDGPNGDLYITIKLKSHPYLVRKDDDLHCEVEVDFVQAMLGTTIKAPALNGRVELKVPPCVQPDQLLRIRGQGLPKQDGSGIGDVYVKLKVLLPTEITPRQRKLLKLFYLDSE